MGLRVILKTEAAVLPATAERVERNTSDSINRRIARETEERIRHYAAHPEQIDGRLAELDAEWDMERTLEANAATLALTGTLLSVFINKRFLILPALVTGFCSSMRSRAGARRCPSSASAASARRPKSTASATP